MTQLESLRDGWRRPGVKWLVAFTAVLIAAAWIITARAEVTTIQLIAPIDIVELTKAIFSGIAALGGIFVTIYLPILSARQKRAEVAQQQQAASLLKVKDNMELIERNTNSISTRNEEIAKQLGMEQGAKKERQAAEVVAAKVAEARREGADTALASVAATAAAVAPAAPVATPATSAAPENK